MSDLEAKYYSIASLNNLTYKEVFPMSKINSSRSGCKDVFHAFLVKNAQYDGHLEIPIIKPQDDIPDKLILFSKILGCKDYDQWVCFYEDDASFERIWNRPERYLPILSKFKGVITPDFSLYRDMPLVMQQWNIYRGRAIGHWLQENGMVRRFIVLCEEL